MDITAARRRSTRVASCGLAGCMALWKLSVVLWVQARAWALVCCGEDLGKGGRMSAQCPRERPVTPKFAGASAAPRHCDPDTTHT